MPSPCRCPCGRKPTGPRQRAHVPVPQPILDELAANPDDCADPTPGQTTKMDAYRVQNGSETLIAVRGRSSCFCSPTGNCEFWIYRSRRGKYEIILHAHMVNNFGFLKDKTDGYPNLVIWSHDSAQRAPARLLLFDRSEYREVCGWEEDYEFRELPDGTWISAGDPKIISNDCEPEHHPRRVRTDS